MSVLAKTISNGITYYFVGAKLKFKRAIVHRQALVDCLKQHAETIPAANILIRSKDGAYSVAQVKRAPVPDEASMIFGDAVHNFRTCLDVLANELVVVNGNVPKGVYFPIPSSKNDLETAINKKMKGISPEAK